MIQTCAVVCMRFKMLHVSWPTHSVVRVVREELVVFVDMLFELLFMIKSFNLLRINSSISN